MIIDTHCHLASKQFKGDLDEVIERAERDKISKLISIGTDLEDSKECIRIANIHDSVYATVGIHPCSVTDISEENWLQIISKLLPLVHIFEEMRNILIYDIINYIQIIKAIFISLLYFIFGIIVFYMSYNGAKVRGTLINMGE